MTDTDIIIEVAKMDGWEAMPAAPECYWNDTLKRAGSVRTSHLIEKRIKLGLEIARCLLPDYLTSRDAIIPVIEKQGVDVILEISRRFTITTPPRELCIALLKATGRW